MLHLMRLELKKIKLGIYIRNGILMNLVFLGLVTAMGFASIYGKDDDLFKSYNEMIILSDVLTRGAFLVFSSVLLNRLTVSEYKEKTVLQLFTYPVARKKIFVAKLIIVCLFTSIACLSCCIFNNMFLFFMSKAGNLFSDATFENILGSLPDCLIGAVMCGFISLIPFYFGMRKKSPAATFISSFIITALLCNSVGSIADSKYMLRILIIGGISIVAAIYTVCVKLNQLENIDL